jgi:hypothetical protein
MECDGKLSNPSINEILVKWLQSPGNELLILAGLATEDWEGRIPHSSITWGEPKFTGLWNFYLRGLWSQPKEVRARAIICDYHKLGHEDVLRTFHPLVRPTALGFRPEGCPLSSQAPAPIRWSP